MKTLTPRVQEGTRLKLLVTAEDADKVTRGPGYKGIVTDLNTGDHYHIYGAMCSAGSCYCDAIAERIEEIEEEDDDTE